MILQFFLPLLRGSGQGRPQLRATFSPAQPQARWDALLSQATTVSSCAFCEQGGHLAAPFSPFQTRCFPAPSQAIRRFPEERGLVDPRLRASNEHLPSVRVPRAGGQPGHTPLPLQARSYTLQEGGVIWSLTARIEGAHSDRAASASTGDQSGLSSLPQPLR